MSFVFYNRELRQPAQLVSHWRHRGKTEKNKEGGIAFPLHGVDVVPAGRNVGKTLFAAKMCVVLLRTMFIRDGLKCLHIFNNYYSSVYLHITYI